MAVITSYSIHYTKLYDRLHAARNRLRQAIAKHLKDALLAVYRANAVEGPYRPDAASAGRRALRNAALSLLMELATVDIRALCYEQYAQSDNMTESFAALGMLANCDCVERDKALDSFYARWRDESLVVDKVITSYSIHYTKLYDARSTTRGCPP